MSSSTLSICKDLGLIVLWDPFSGSPDFFFRILIVTKNLKNKYHCSPMVTRNPKYIYIYILRRVS